MRFIEFCKKIRTRGPQGIVRSLSFRARSAPSNIWSMIDNPHRFLRGVDGVIHVGANSGQELELYAKYNLRVLWIEPLPDIFETLQENIRGFPAQSALMALVTDKDDAEYVFNIASNDGASSSIFEFGRVNEIWPEINYVSSIKIKSVTLDRLLGKVSEEYQALIMDTQGSELLVLKGATNLLRHVKFVRTEAADFESYRGCARVDDLTTYLESFGFTLIRKDKFAESPKGGKYFDILYGRR
jgi:FkbM family methyltransferase